jgi:hypothetical protein
MLVKRLAKLGLTHMWNGPTGKVFVEVGSSRGGAVICPAY